MPRLTQLEDVLFPVGEHPVFANVRGVAGDTRLPVPDKKAIVNVLNSRVLGIVSRCYRLVTNREALDWAYICCRAVFPKTEPGEWEVQVIDAPATGGHCFVDLAHNSTTLDFSLVPSVKRPEVYGPFVRVTNSYNGFRALAFDIGFYRKICTNGLIGPDSVIRFKFSHSRHAIGKTIQFEVAHDRLEELKTKYEQYFTTLRTCAVRREELEPFVLGVLLLRPAKQLQSNTREANEWEALSTYVGKLCDRYSRDMGENAYSVFNAITDFASHPPLNRYVRRDRNSLQRIAGSWLVDFNQRCRRPGFDLSQYLIELPTRDSKAPGVLAEGIAHGI
jgi:hypothetical protein